MVRIIAAALVAARPLASIALILAALLPALALRARPRRWPAPAAPQVLRAADARHDAQPLNLGELKNQLYFYACSGAYDSDLNKVLAGARAYVEAARRACRKPALVLDIDETSLSAICRSRSDRRFRLHQRHSLRARHEQAVRLRRLGGGGRGRGDRRHAGAVQGGQAEKRRGVLHHRPPRERARRDGEEPEGGRL